MPPKQGRHWRFGYGAAKVHVLSRVLVAIGITLATLSFGVVLGVPGAPPVFAATVINGCAIVANPTPTSHTRCPGADLSGANFTTTNLSYADLKKANLSGATLAQCTLIPPPNFSVVCDASNLTGAQMTGSSLSGAKTSSCVTFPATPTLTAVRCDGAIFTGADLRRAILSNTDLSSANLSRSSLTGASFAGANLVSCFQIAAGGYQECPGADLSNAVIHRASLAGFDLSTVNLSGSDLTGSNLAAATFGLIEPPGIGTFPTPLVGANLTNVNLSGTRIGMADLSQANLDRANLTATSLVPSNQVVSHTSSKGAVVTWPTPPSQPGATPGPCNRQSGSTFRIGSTAVKCLVADSLGHQAKGTFTVTVT